MIVKVSLRLRSPLDEVSTICPFARRGFRCPDTITTSASNKATNGPTVLACFLAFLATHSSPSNDHECCRDHFQSRYWRRHHSGGFLSRARNDVSHGPDDPRRKRKPSKRPSQRLQPRYVSTPRGCFDGGHRGVLADFGIGTLATGSVTGSSGNQNRGLLRFECPPL